MSGRAISCLGCFMPRKAPRCSLNRRLDQSFFYTWLQTQFHEELKHNLVADARSQMDRRAGVVSTSVVVCFVSSRRPNSITRLVGNTAEMCSHFAGGHFELYLLHVSPLNSLQLGRKFSLKLVGSNYSDSLSCLHFPSVNRLLHLCPLHNVPTKFWVWIAQSA